MDPKRRSFLILLSAALPAAIAAPHLLSQPVTGAVENETEELWALLAEIKDLPSRARIKEMSKLNDRWVELRGFLGDTRESVASKHQYILTPGPISCCVPCSIFGLEPFILVDSKAKTPGYSEPVNIRGQLKLLDKLSVAYLHMDDAQVV